MTQTSAPARAGERAWLMAAIQSIGAEGNRWSDTHLIRMDLPLFPGIKVYLKDESSHPTGSLKHQLARSLFLYVLSNALIGPETTLIEASSGSTAVSEAYFAKLLGLRFIAIVPACTAAAKLDAIRFYGGEIHTVDDPRAIYAAARRLGAEPGGYFLDQFTYAERVTDWRCNNIAESIFAQMALEPAPIPTWIVCGAGTGGTSATIGRYLRYKGHSSRLCVADPSHSLFHRHFADRTQVALPEGCRSQVEGVGRAVLEPSFMPSVIDRMIAVTDSESFGAMRALSVALGRTVGGSTGTNLWACAVLLEEMARDGQTGSIVTLLCDRGERYRETYHDDGWLADRGIAWAQPARRIARLIGAA